MFLNLISEFLITMFHCGLSINWIRHQFVSIAVAVGCSQCKGPDHLVSSLHSPLILSLYVLMHKGTGSVSINRTGTVDVMYLFLVTWLQ